MNSAKLSVIVPAFNEKRNIVPLYNAVKKVLSKMGVDYEIIFIDDGSTDNTFDEVKRIIKADTRVKGISFTRNFGKAAALDAGFKKSTGSLIVTMDSDLQDNPEELPKFLSMINKGYDMVVGWKYVRRDSFAKVIASRMFNSLIRVSTGLKLHDNDSGYKMFRREVISSLTLYSGLYRYIPVFAHRAGYKVCEVKVKHMQRKFGKSKYGASRLFKGFFDLITINFLSKFTTRPLHFFGSLGGFFMFFGFLGGLYLSYLRFFYDAVIGNRPLLLLSILLIVIGLQIFSVGLVGEMISFLNKKQNPEKPSDDYNIREVAGG